MSTKLVDCKYCGRPNLAWTKSKKGRWYLSHVNAARGGAAYGHSNNATYSGGYYITGQSHTRDECEKGKGRSKELWNEMRLFSEGTFSGR